MALHVEYHGPDAERLFGDYARVFVEHFGTGRSDAVALDGFTGRILRGRAESDFATLTDDPRRRVVFLTDAAAFCTLIGCDGREILAQIGYDEAFIKRLLVRQTRFKLALFPDLEKRLATWDNLLDLVCTAYPEWRAAVERVRPNLKTSPFEALAGEAAEVRARLADVLNVNRLFAGDGYTRREVDPQRRVHPEYVILNRPLIDLPATCLIDFPVGP
ncbi:MAG: hypothetical protein EHM39_02620 [Chloroflexi bacterium]|nr:MAG: hypothetical protein EHM39_02620 [Chloroflexota bacterium]